MRIRQVGCFDRTAPLGADWIGREMPGRYLVGKFTATNILGGSASAVDTAVNKQRQGVLPGRRLTVGNFAEIARASCASASW